MSDQVENEDLVLDDLECFLHWWMDERPFLPPVDEPATEYADGVTATTIYREDQYQVQMIIVPPNHVIPPHVHPQVDSFEVYVSGDVLFRVEGEVLVESPTLGMVQRVKPDAFHGGDFGPRGGVFLSVQKWADGVKPTSVGYDWAEANNDNATGSAKPMKEAA